MKSYAKHLHVAGLAASMAFAFATAYAADPLPAAPDKDPLPVFDNSITLSGQGNWASGDKSAFQAENWTAKNGFGGIQDFQYSQDVGKDVTAKSDGHALFGNADYLLHTNVVKTDVGSVDVGYKRFRTFYDNAGGFFLPTGNSWLPIFPSELAVDRSKFWAEANLTLPNAPVLTLRYTNELRNGRKESTEWGASDYTGLSAPSNSTSVASRYIAPGYLELGERHQSLEAILKHTVGNTTFELSVLGDRVDNLDTRYFNRYPGQVKWPVIKTTPVTTVGPSTIENFNNAITGFDQLGNKANTYVFTGKVETVLSERVKIHAGMSYSLLNSDFTEFRPLFTLTPYPTAAPIGAVSAESINALGLVGGAKIKTYTANMGGDFKIRDDLTTDIGLKIEDRHSAASDTYQTLGTPTVSNAGVVTLAKPATDRAASRESEQCYTPEIGLRYTGIKNISLYGTAEYRYVNGNESVTPQYNITTTPSPANSDIGENHGRYTVGANWVPCGFFTLRGETFYKDHQNNFQYNTTSTSQFVLGYKLKGAKLTATVKPLPTVTLTTRYVYQTGTMDTASAVSLDYQSMNTKSHNIGETIDWTPIKQFYMQANVNVVFDTTSTAYPRAGAQTAASAGNNALRNADNNYWDGSVIAGFVLDKATDAEVEATNYKSDNYQPALIATTLPYGASERDYTITVGLKRKLTDRLVAEVKVGYMSSKNDTTGGNANYTGRVAYVSLQQAF